MFVIKRDRLRPIREIRRRFTTVRPAIIPPADPATETSDVLSGVRRKSDSTVRTPYESAFVEGIHGCVSIVLKFSPAKTIKL